MIFQGLEHCGLPILQKRSSTKKKMWGATEKELVPLVPHIVNTRNVCIMDVCVGHLAFWCGYGVRIFLWGWHYYKMWVQFIIQSLFSKSMNSLHTH